MMTELEFEALASEGYNRIALVSECMSDLETPLIPAYHRAPAEKCAGLYLTAGYHDVELQLKDVDENDLFWFYVVNPANHFAAEIDCVAEAERL